MIEIPKVERERVGDGQKGYENECGRLSEPTSHDEDQNVTQGANACQSQIVNSEYSESQHFNEFSSFSPFIAILGMIFWKLK